MTSRERPHDAIGYAVGAIKRLAARHRIIDDNDLVAHLHKEVNRVERLRAFDQAVNRNLLHRLQPAPGRREGLFSSRSYEGAP